MRFPVSLPTSDFWKYVDEVDGRDLDLSYPTQIIKAVKRAYFDKGVEWFIDDDIGYNLISQRWKEQRLKRVVREMQRQTGSV